MNNDTYTTSPSTASGSPPDLTSYRGIHATIRRANDQLVAGIDNLSPIISDRPTAAALGRWFNGYRGELHSHHVIEDVIFFPALAERVPSFDEYAVGLDADHHRLDELLDAVGRGLERLQADEDWADARCATIAAAVELRDLMASHLEVEDRDILPMFERHFGAEEYLELDKLALANVDVRQALFAVPWFMATAPSDARAHTWGHAPLALKVVFFATRRRYARLELAAFGLSAASASIVRTRP